MKSIKKSVIGICVASTMLLIGTTVFADTGIVNTDTLNLRKDPSTSSSILKQLSKNQKVEILEENGDWYKVKINELEGYLHKDYVKKEETSDTNNNQKPENNDKPEEKPNNIQDNDIVNQEIKLEKETNIYILPLINSTKIAKAKVGEVVRVISNTNKWLYVETEEVNGWIVNESSVGEIINNKEEQKPEENEEKPEENVEKPEENKDEEQNKNDDNNKQNNENKNEDVAITEKTMYVNSPSIYVRKGPGTNYDIVDSLILNSGVVVTAENGDWYKVKVSGIEGYIAKRLLSNTRQETSSSRGESERTINTTINNNEQTSTSTSTSKGEEIVAYAKQYLGCKYVYGGAGPTTFDCSGFTMYVYAHFGVNLSHGATAQSRKGTYVAKSDLQPGDLVFFKDYETMEGIGHCGIYIGNGDFIHASSGTGYCVKISTLLSGSYNTRYETARRIF